MRLIRRTTLVVLLILGLAAWAFPLQGQEAQTVHVLTLTGVINPPAASYVERGIEGAQRAGAHAVVLRIDTPGGLDNSTRRIVQSIANANLPVIMYVSPSGGRAASAGTFIGMASHVLAMAPGTTIGAATPVALGAGGGAQELPEDLRRKIIEDSVSFIRSHADLRGRNADWAERAVREGATLGSAEAVEQNVAELLARDLEDVLAQAHGMEVTLWTGETVRLETEGAVTQDQEMDFITRFLHTIANPDIAFILLSLAVLGIFFELANPGLIFPGVVGGVSLLLGFYALGTLNAFWGGALLVILALGLLIAEAVTPTYGILGLGGVVALIIGGSLLFLNAPPGVAVDAWTLWTVAGVAAVLVMFFSWAILSTRRQSLATGYPSLIGKTAVARTPLSPDGYVLIHGERWRAHLKAGEASPGEEVLVERAEGMDLWVRKQSEAKGG